MTDITIKQKLLEYYSGNFPKMENIQISNFEQLTDGWETEIYAFTLSQSIHPRQDLILRVYPGRDAHSKSAWEFSAMKNLKNLGYPVPEVFHLDRERSPFSDKPFCIMERIHGKLLGDVSDPTVIDLFASLFVQLHNLEWQKLVPDASSYSSTTYLEETLDRSRSRIKNSGMNGFLEPLSWIQKEIDRRDIEITPAATHNDFHPYNIILDKNNHPYVIDWGGFAIADYRMDLAWALMLINAYRSKKRSELFLKRYKEISEKHLEHLDLFDVMACTRRLFSVVVSIERGPGELGMRPEAGTKIAEDLEPHKRVYSLFKEHTQMSIPEVDTLISKLERG